MEELLKYIDLLEKSSFEGWSKEAKKGYLTACTSIKIKAKKLSAKNNHDFTQKDPTINNFTENQKENFCYSCTTWDCVKCNRW